MPALLFMSSVIVLCGFSPTGTAPPRGADGDQSRLCSAGLLPSARPSFACSCAHSILLWSFVLFRDCTLVAASPRSAAPTVSVSGELVADSVAAFDLEGRCKANRSETRPSAFIDHCDNHGCGQPAASRRIGSNLEHPKVALQSRNRNTAAFKNPLSR